MENHFVEDMNDKIRFLTKQFSISFCQKDHNGRVPYPIACMWGNAQFLLCGLTLDPDFRNNMNIVDHQHCYPTFYMFQHRRKAVKSVPSLQTLSSVGAVEFLNERVLSDILFEEKKTSSGKSCSHPRRDKLILSDESAGQLIEKYFHDSMCLSELTFASEKLKQVYLSERYIVSLFTNASKGVVDMENTHNRKQIADVLELLQIVGREMGKIYPLFECVPNFKGSVQENTKCGSLDELDVAMNLVTFTEYFDSEIVSQRSVRFAAIQPKVPSCDRYFKDDPGYFAKVRLCVDFCQTFLKALGTKSVCQFLKRSGIAIEHYQRKHGFVGILTLSCKCRDGIQTMSVDVAPCIDGIRGFTALLQPK